MAQGASALNVKVKEIQTTDVSTVLWLKARQLCHLGGHAPESGEIIGILQKLKDSMPADLADSWKKKKRPARPTMRD